MPLYEYQCESCDKVFERIQKFSDPPVETCPSCGGKVRKLLSSPAIQFKGTGWYITDYARKSGDSGKSSAGKDAKDGKENKDSKDSKDTATPASGSTESKSTSAAPAKSEA
jgi:putative FmdB family regulatory protein